MTATAEIETSAAGRLLSLAQSIRDEEPVDLARLRAKGIESFATLGLPHTRLEAWRYTNVAPAMKAPLSLPDRKAAVDRVFSDGSRRLPRRDSSVWPSGERNTPSQA